jgi:CRISPR system Cascade subunit CasC
VNRKEYRTVNDNGGLFVEFHLIQSLGVTSMNRGEDGLPKGCYFGGGHRARVSSQAWKRATRQSPHLVGGPHLKRGTRTQKVVQVLIPCLLQGGFPEDEARLVAAGFALALAGKMHQKHPDRTATLIFLAPSDLNAAADLLVDNWAECLEAARATVGEAEKPPADEPVGEEAEEEAAGPRKVHPTFQRIINALAKQGGGVTDAVDLALYGRMLARQPIMGLRGAVQMAHPISTHTAQAQPDFYIAADDLAEPGEAIAVMMDTIQFHSPCLYRYANVDFGQLCANLGGDAEVALEALVAFAQAFVLSIPEGRSHAMATPTRPAAVMAVVRRGAPLTLVNAFENPVRPPYGDGGVVAASIKALDTHWQRVAGVYGTDDVETVAVVTEDPDIALPNLGQHRVSSLADVLLGCRVAVARLWAEE